MVINMMTNEIKKLRREAEAQGDLRQAMICVLALGGRDALEGAEPGTEAEALLSERRTQEWAACECKRHIEETAAEVRHQQTLEGRA